MKLAGRKRVDYVKKLHSAMGCSQVSYHRDFIVGISINVNYLCVGRLASF